VVVPKEIVTPVPPWVCLMVPLLTMEPAIAAPCAIMPVPPGPVVSMRPLLMIEPDPDPLD
jgi:hypothetical protein